MKISTLLTGFFTLLLCLGTTSLDAQCKKNRTARSSEASEIQTRSRSYYGYQKKKQCYQRQYTCRKNKDTKETQQTESRKILNTYNFAGAFVGVASLFDTDQTVVTAGAEYERRISNNVGLGLLAEVVTGRDFTLNIGVPISFHPTQRLRLMAAPLASMQQQTSSAQAAPSSSDAVNTVKEWNTSYGGRVGLSYYITTRGLRIAPTVAADLVGGNYAMRYGVTAGIGF